MIKKILTFMLFFLLFSVGVSAQESIYQEQLEISGAQQIEEGLPPEIQQYLEEYSIDISDYDWVNSLDYKNVFSHIWSFITKGIKTHLACFGCVIAIILISAALNSNALGSLNQTVSYIIVLSVVAVISAPLYSCVTASVEALKDCSYFITAFVPVFASIVAAGGKAVTSLSMSTLLLAASSGMNYIASYVIIPLISGYLTLSISSSVSPLLNNSGLCEGIKKLVFWLMSLTSTIFVGILGIQTAVNSAADNLTMKTAKFIVGSSVPIAGGVLSEALGTLTASIALLKSSVGIYGVIICCLFFLPILIELLLWRVTLFAGSFASDIFSLPKLSYLLKSIDTVLSVLVGIILISCAMFVISLTVVIGSGK